MGEGEGGKSESLKRHSDFRVNWKITGCRTPRRAHFQTALHALLWESWRVFLFLVSAIDYGCDPSAVECDCIAHSRAGFGNQIVGGMGSG